MSTKFLSFRDPSGWNRFGVEDRFTLLEVSVRHPYEDTEEEASDTSLELKGEVWARDNSLGIDSI